MKLFYSILLLASCLVPSVSFGVETWTNYPAYSLENVVAYEVSHDNDVLFSIEKSGSGNRFVSRNLATGAITLDVSLDIPKAYLLNTVLLDNDVYLFTVEILSREKRLMETSIFKISCHDGHIETLYKSKEQLGFAEKFFATKNGLLLTEKRGNNPFLFNLRSKKMTPIELPDDFRIRSFNFEQNSAIIVEQNNFSTQVKSNDGKESYIEGDGNPFNVHVCNFSDKFSLTKVGLYQPSYVVSEIEENNSFPYLTMENDHFPWVTLTFMNQRHPSPPFNLRIDPHLKNLWESLVGFHSITAITFAGDEFALGRVLKEDGGNNLAIYNLKKPKLEKEESVSHDDLIKIRELLFGQTFIEKTALEFPELARIFTAKFYEIKMVTTTTDTSEWGVETMTSTESFKAVAEENDYVVFKKCDQLASYLVDGFVMKEANAILFQDALDVLFPLGTFDIKHRDFYYQEGKWFFIRSESFGEKSGFVVNVDDAGAIVGIESQDGLVKN